MAWAYPDSVAVRLQLGGDYKTRILADAPRAYWRLNETAGLSFADATGNGNTGTIASATHYTLGVASAQPDLSKGLACDNAQATLAFPAWATGTTWSFEMWIKITGTGPVPYSLIISAGGGGNGFYINPSTGKPNFFYSGADHIFATALATGTLYHLALVVNAGAVTLYINGVADANTFSSAPTINVSSLLAGNSGGGIGASLVNDAAIYAYALTAAQVALHASAGVWTDITADLTDEDLVLDYGIRSSKPEDRVATTGTFTFGLRNDAANSGAALGWYSPYSATRRAGFDFKIRTQLAVAYSGITYYWLGRLRVIDAVPDSFGPRVTHCVALDWFDEAARANTQVALQQNTDGGAAFAALVACVSEQPRATSIGVGSDTYVYAFDNIWQNAKVLSAAADLARSELGYIFQRRDTTAGETIVYENRHTRVTTTAIRATLTTVLTSLKITPSADEIVNRVRVRVYPRLTSAGQVVAALQPSTSSPASIGAGETQVVWLDYTDPVQRSSRIGARDQVALAATTDYTLNALADGSGADLTAALSVSATNFASSVKLTVTNTGTTPAFITKLQQRGTAIYTLTAVEVEAMAGAGDTVAVLDLPYQSDPALAKLAASYIASLYATPLAAVQGVSFTANESATLLTAALAGEISDKVQIAETVTGLTTAGAHYINAVNLRFGLNGLVECTWRLVPADTASYWVLEQAGSSELAADASGAGGSTRLGF